MEKDYETKIELGFDEENEISCYLKQNIIDNKIVSSIGLAIDKDNKLYVNLSNAQKGFDKLSHQELISSLKLMKEDLTPSQIESANIIGATNYNCERRTFHGLSYFEQNSFMNLREVNIEGNGEKSAMPPEMFYGCYLTSVQLDGSQIVPWNAFECSTIENLSSPSPITENQLLAMQTFNTIIRNVNTPSQQESQTATIIEQ